MRKQTTTNMKQKQRKKRYIVSASQLMIIFDISPLKIAKIARKTQNIFIPFMWRHCTS